MASISETTVPFLYDHVEVVKHDLAEFPSQSWGDLVRPRLLKIEGANVQPQLAFSIPFSCVNMDRLISFIGIKEDTPAPHKDDCRHMAETMNVSPVDSFTPPIVEQEAATVKIQQLLQ
jgi:hypothetical protein